MRCSLVLAAVLAGCQGLGEPAPAATAAVDPWSAWDGVAGAPIALVGASLVDGTGAPPVPDSVVVIRGDRVDAVGRRGEVPIPPEAVVVDLGGHHIIPGLVDAHVHLFQSGGLHTRPDILDLRAVRSYEDEAQAIQVGMEDMFRRYLASGVTAVVDMGGPFWNFDVRDRAAEEPVAPHLAVAGPLISTVSRPELDLGDPPIIRAETPEEARELVRRQAEMNPDLAKIWFILPEDGDIQANLPVVTAAFGEARAAGLRVAVHATQLETARAAVEAGCQILAHSVDDALVDSDFTDLLLEREVTWIPTLAVYQGYAGVLGGEPELTDVELALGCPRALRSFGELPDFEGDRSLRDVIEARVASMEARLPVMQENLRRVHRAGVTIAAGTDAGNIGTLHGPSLHRELSLMADAGMNPAEVLVAATRNGARVFSSSPALGTVEEGMLASLLVLGSDPMESVESWSDISRVIHRGRAWSPGELVPLSPQVVVQRQVEAYNARDVESFLSFFSPDVTVYGLPEGAVRMEGREELRRAYSALFQESPELNCRILDRIVSGSYVMDHELVTGMRGGPPVRAVATYEVEGGLIRRVWFLPKE